MACFFLYESLVEVKTINGPVWFVLGNVEDALNKLFRFALFLNKNNDLMYDIWENIAENTLSLHFFLFLLSRFFIRFNFPGGFLTVAF